MIGMRYIRPLAVRAPAHRLRAWGNPPNTHTRVSPNSFPLHLRLPAGYHSALWRLGATGHTATPPDTSRACRVPAGFVGRFLHQPARAPRIPPALRARYRVVIWRPNAPLPLRVLSPAPPCIPSFCRVRFAATSWGRNCQKWPFLYYTLRLIS